MSKDAADRFYLMKLRDREAFWGDIGSNIKIEGLVVGNSEEQLVMMLPGTDVSETVAFIHPSLEDWSDFIIFSDDPLVLTDLNRKVFARKLRYQISGAVQQRVWAADGLQCFYCEAKMGEALLTIDHFEPIELGGTNDTSNYLTACSKCNKAKANDSAVEWCRRQGFDVDAIRDYLKRRKL